MRRKRSLSWAAAAAVLLALLLSVSAQPSADDYEATTADRTKIVAYAGAGAGAPCELAPIPKLTGERPPTYCEPGMFVCAAHGAADSLQTTKGICAAGGNGTTSGFFLLPDFFPSPFPSTPLIAWRLTSRREGLAPLYASGATTAGTAAPTSSATNVAFTRSARFGGALRCGNGNANGDGNDNDNGDGDGDGSGGRVELSAPGLLKGGYGTVAFFVRVAGQGPIAAPENGTFLSVYLFHHSAGGEDDNGDGNGSGNGNGNDNDNDDNDDDDGSKSVFTDLGIGLMPRLGGGNSSSSSSASLSGAPLAIRAVIRRGPRKAILLDTDGAVGPVSGRPPLDLRDGEWRLVVVTAEEAAGGGGASSTYRYRLFVDGEVRAWASVQHEAPPPPPPPSSAPFLFPRPDAPVVLCSPPPARRRPAPPAGTTAPAIFLANAALYSRALTAAQVAALHAAWLRAAVSSAAGLGPEQAATTTTTTTPGGRERGPMFPAPSTGGVPIFSPLRPEQEQDQAAPPPPPGALKAASGHACLLPSVVASPASSSPPAFSSSPSLAAHYGCVALAEDARPLDAPIGARAFCVTAEALALGGDGNGWEPCPPASDTPGLRRRLRQVRGGERPTTPSSQQQQQQRRQGQEPTPRQPAPLLVPLAPRQRPPRLTVGGRACAPSSLQRGGNGGGGAIPTDEEESSVCVAAPGALAARCSVAGDEDEDGGECAPLIEVPARGSPCAAAARALGLGERLAFGRCVAELGVMFCAEKKTGDGQQPEQWWRCPPLPSSSSSSVSSAPRPRVALSADGTRLVPCRSPGQCVMNTPLGRFQCVPGATAAAQPRPSRPLTCAPALRRAFSAADADDIGQEGGEEDAPFPTRPCAVPFFYRGSLHDDCVALDWPGGIEGCPLAEAPMSGPSNSSAARWGLCRPRAPVAARPADPLLVSAAVAARKASVTYTTRASACALPFSVVPPSQAAAAGNNDNNNASAQLWFGCAPAALVGGDDTLAALDGGVCPSATHAGALVPCARSNASSSSGAPAGEASGASGASGATPPPPGAPPPRPQLTMPGQAPCAAPYASGRGSGAPPGSGAEVGPPSLVWGGTCVSRANGDAGICRVASGAWRRCVAPPRRGARTGAPCLFPFPWVGQPEGGATDCVRLDGGGGGGGGGGLVGEGAEGVCHVGGGAFEPCAPLGEGAVGGGGGSSPSFSSSAAGGGEAAWQREGGGRSRDAGPVVAAVLAGVVCVPLALLLLVAGVAVAIRRRGAPPRARAAPATAPPTVAAPEAGADAEAALTEGGGGAAGLSDVTVPPPPPPPSPPLYPPPPPAPPADDRNAAAARVAKELAAARERLFSSRTPGVRELVMQMTPARRPALGASASASAPATPHVLSPLSSPGSSGGGARVGEGGGGGGGAAAATPGGR